MTSIPVAGRPFRAVITPSGADVYLSFPEENQVGVIDTMTKTVTHTLPVANYPVSMAMSPDGSKVYVGQAQGSLSIIDTASKRVTPLDTFGKRVDDLLITPDGGTLYLAMDFAGLQRMDTRTHLISAVSGHCPKGLTLTPDGRFLYVSYQSGGPGGAKGHDAIGKFDAATGEFLGSIAGLPHVAAS